MGGFESRITADGSQTFYSAEFGENFHTKYGAKSEAEITYIEGCRLGEKLKQENQIKILDVCYGLGYNTAAALDCIQKINPDCEVEIIALELDESVPRQALENNLLCHWSSDIVDILERLLTFKQIRTPRLKIDLLIGDARQTLPQVNAQNFQADAIFHDPFSPPKCPQLWTVEFFCLLTQYLNQDGIIATYSCSASIRRALQLAGLKVGANNAVGRRSPGTLGAFPHQDLPPLSMMELEHLQTKASIPFRDPNLQDSAKIITERREKEQILSHLTPTSQWKKQWFPRQNLR